MNSKFAQYDYLGVLTFHDELTREHLDEFRATLMMSLATVEHLIVSMGKGMVIDPCCLDLLRKIQQSSEAYNKRVTLIGVSSHEHVHLPAKLCDASQAISVSGHS